MEQSIEINEIQTSLDAAMPVTSAGQTSFIDTIKNQFQGVMDKLKDSKSILIDVALYGGIGFLTGFLFRKYSTYIAFLVLFLVGLIVLQQMNVITIAINWIKVEELFGIQQGTTTINDTLLGSFWEWVKANFIIVVSYIVGFLFGLRVG
ncbi:MAG TPA: FUN14 domain-containing protein [Candidatus Dependentiae bacterium]|nr:FUN14 domain-containing protein [Candidatus Dependentiae bacterium]HRQ62677.1 FUN14 domain-containing protein [Candidatus Dependentiae bacterium]